MRPLNTKTHNASLDQLSLGFDGGYDSSTHLLSRLKANGLALPLLALIVFSLVILTISASFGEFVTGVLITLFLCAAAVVFLLLLRGGRPEAVSSQSKIHMVLVENQTDPSAIVDEDGSLVVANTAYGEVFPGYPSPKADIVGFKIQKIPLPDSKNQWWVFKESKADIPQDELLSNQEVSQIINRLGVAVLTLDENRNIVEASDNLIHWLGVEKDDIIGKSQDDVFLSLNAERAVCNMKQGDPLLFDVVELPAQIFPGHKSYGFARPGHPSQAFMSDDEIANIPEQLFDQAPAGIALVDQDGNLKRCNEPLRRLAGQEIRLDEKVSDLFLEADRDNVNKTLEAAFQTQASPLPLEVRFAGDSGNVAQLFVRGLQGGNGAVLYLLDTTEQKQLELQFTQAQKMQAVGQLAGGIAHDFNNILTAIIGFCDLLLVRHGAGDASFSDIMQIKQNANRAANLVRQLLAFSRQQTLRPSVLLVTDVLAELSNLLRRLIGENIELNMVHGRDLGHVKVDQGQLEQVIINLAVNARDAMPKGGRLTISTSALPAKDVAALEHGFMPEQDYVCLIVEDTGHGIPKNLLTKVFDPFFTTKEVGKGTGLGLSTVYGIVKQTGGFIFAGEAESHGARFTIYLPVHVPEESEIPSAPQAKAPTEVTDLWGHGTILLVEDEDAVRTFAYRALDKKGYKVLEADSGEAALEVAREYDGVIDLILSDVIMPNMDGPTMVSKLRGILPDAKIIFISGYAQDSFRNGFEQEEHHFLPKPFSLSQLAEKVKAVLTEE